MTTYAFATWMLIIINHAGEVHGLRGFEDELACKVERAATLRMMLEDELWGIAVCEPEPEVAPVLAPEPE